MTWILDQLLPAYDFRTRLLIRAGGAGYIRLEMLHGIARRAEGLQ